MLRDRENFYIMAGTSGATLIGWLFVVVTPGANWTTSPGKLGLDAFITPTLVHFCGVLFIAMAVLVPWPSVWPVSIIFGPCGLIGLAWRAHTIRMKHRRDFVSLGWQDWIPHAGFPALGNASLIAGVTGLAAGKPFTPYAIAGAVTLILIAGINGAWHITLCIVRNWDGTSRPGRLGHSGSRGPVTLTSPSPTARNTPPAAADAALADLAAASAR